MAGGVSKEEQSLTRGAQLVQSARGDLGSQLDGLRGKLSHLVTDWQGSGGSAFTGVMERWDADSRKIIGALDEFEANLRSSEQTYDAADEQQGATFSKISSRLG